MKKLILASASWCSPCQAIKMQLQSENLTDLIEIRDADNDSVFFKSNNIKSVPRLLIMDGETIIETITGSENIVKRIKSDI